MKRPRNVVKDSKESQVIRMMRMRCHERKISRHVVKWVVERGNPPAHRIHKIESFKQMLCCWKFGMAIPGPWILLNER